MLIRSFKLGQAQYFFSSSRCINVPDGSVSLFTLNQWIYKFPSNSASSLPLGIVSFHSRPWDSSSPSVWLSFEGLFISTVHHHRSSDWKTLLLTSKAFLSVFRLQRHTTHNNEDKTRHVCPGVGNVFFIHFIINLLLLLENLKSLQVKKVNVSSLVTHQDSSTSCLHWDSAGRPETLCGMWQGIKERVNPGEL